MISSYKYIITLTLLFAFQTVKSQTLTKETKEYKKGLYLDLYQPVGSNSNKLPLILFTHGGGFAGGSRSDAKVTTFCNQMAKEGYVVASISYTLTMKGKSFGCDQASQNKLSTFSKVGQEVNDATAYLLSISEDIKIDSNQIILAGSSAGAEAVLHAAYMPELQIGLPNNFRYAGLISMAGAISNNNLITKENAIPMQFFHGTCDPLVPYDIAPHHYCNENEYGYLILFGSGAISDRLRSLNKGYYLVTACNGNHDWADIPLTSNFERIVDFIENDVVGKKLRQVHEVISSSENCSIANSLEICSSN